MSSVGVTLLSIFWFTLLTRVTALTTPWLNKEFKFACTPVCSEYLKGETLDCLLVSPYGLSAGRMVLRILPNLEWRYYGISEDGNTKEFCRSIMAADDFYYSRNTTICHLVLYRNEGLEGPEGITKPFVGYNDDRTDALCFWASRDMCLKKEMLVCVNGACCWAIVDPDLCAQISFYGDINHYRESLFHIIQHTKTI